MKRTMSVMALILATAIAVAAQEKQAKPAEDAKPSAAMPTVDQVIDKYVQALGGKAAIEKITSRVSKGAIEISIGANGTAEIFEKAPNKSAAVIDIAGFGLVKEGYNGTVAWSDNPQTGMREKSGVELADAKLDAEFYKPLKMKALYPKMEMQAKQKVNNRDAYVIMATPAAGSAEKWFFDAETGLLVRTDAERESPEGKIPVETYIEDYREIDGVKLPFTVRQVLPQFSIIIKIEQVKHNVPIEDAKFEKPASQ
ncbi:MAG TPA: hypothetical protein VLD57_10055 [Blastocatellia bacterium]|nr:hypothetical protein [Blastocatellia bacterium]